MDRKLYTVEGGRLLATDPFRAVWSEVGEANWGRTVALAAANGFIWSIESDGTLFKSNRNGAYVQVGKRGEYEGVEHLLAFDNRLYTIESGTLYATR
jgi:hypothetical protein